MKVTVKDNQKAYLTKNGKFVKLLDAGTYHLFFGEEIEIAYLAEKLWSSEIPLKRLLQDEKIKANTISINVPDGYCAVHFVNGMYYRTLSSGEYAFWTVYDKHEFKLIDKSEPLIDLPKAIIQQLPPYAYSTKIVQEGQKGLLFYNGKFIKVLEAGDYNFWKTQTEVEVRSLDAGLTQLKIDGQEIMTVDKVPVRISFVCNYRIADFVKVITDIDDYKEQLHLVAQMALRDYICKRTLDEILSDRSGMGAFCLEKMREKENSLFVKIEDAGVKDIILPGEIREIMNTVLIAEKRAQANVITRREETASTRSLLNTAKLMDENATLYRLKELEYIERICENVGSVNLGGNGDILSLLAGAIKPSKQ